MNAYEKELRKLVELPAGVSCWDKDVSDYGKLVRKLAEQFPELPNDKSRQEAALEILFRAVQLVALAVLPKAAPSFGFNYNKKIDTKNNYYDENKPEANDKNFLKFIEREVELWVKQQLWTCFFDDELKLYEISEKLLRYVIFVIYLKNGIREEQGNTSWRYILPLKFNDYYDGVTSWAYQVNNDVCDIMNIAPEDFASLFNDFKLSLGIKSIKESTIVNDFTF